MQKAIRSKHESIFASISAYENPWLLPSQIDQVFSKLLQKKKTFTKAAAATTVAMSMRWSKEMIVCALHTQIHMKAHKPQTHTHTCTLAQKHPGIQAHQLNWIEA